MDNVVKITATGELRGMASAKTRARAVDPFDETADSDGTNGVECDGETPCLAESDNYCITTPGDSGTATTAGFPGLL